LNGILGIKLHPLQDKKHISKVPLVGPILLTMWPFLGPLGASIFSKQFQHTCGFLHLDSYESSPFLPSIAGGKRVILDYSGFQKAPKSPIAS
jgi:hypothetical protein